VQLAHQLEARAGVRPLGARLPVWLRAARNVGVRLLRVGAILRRRAAVRDLQTTAWTPSLRQVIADLDLLNHNTEQDFLRIGGKLAEFIEAVNLISSELTALANLISGSKGHANPRRSRALWTVPWRWV
jgi:hypothetical protein